MISASGDRVRVTRGRPVCNPDHLLELDDAVAQPLHLGLGLVPFRRVPGLDLDQRPERR